MKMPARCASLIVACLLQASAVAGQTLPAPPVMDQAVSSPLADQMRINGTPTRVVMFRSDKSVDEVRAFYRRQFGSAHVETQDQGWLLLSRLDGDLMYMARLHRTLEGTEGTVSVADLREGRKNAGRSPGVEMPAGSQLVLDVEMDDAGKHSRVLTIVNDHPIATNADYFRNSLAAHGYRLKRAMSGGDQAAGGQSLWFDAPDRDAMVVISPRDGGSNVVINMQDTRQGGR